MRRPGDNIVETMWEDQYIPSHLSLHHQMPCFEIDKYENELHEDIWYQQWAAFETADKESTKSLNKYQETIELNRFRKEQSAIPVSPFLIEKCRIFNQE